MPRSKVSAFLSVLLVFASGAAMGAVGYRLYSVKSVPSITSGATTIPKKTPEEYRKLVVNSLKDAVKLDDRQLTEVQKIYEDEFAAFHQIRTKYDAQIKQIHADNKREIDQMHLANVAKMKALLRPDQQPLYDKWLADRAASREADRKRHQQQEHDHPDGKQRPPLP